MDLNGRNSKCSLKQIHLGGKYLTAVQAKNAGVFMQKKENEKDVCLREEWRNGQIVLKPSHGDCPACPNFRICPDPVVIKMREEK